MQQISVIGQQDDHRPLGEPHWGRLHLTLAAAHSTQCQVRYCTEVGSIDLPLYHVLGRYAIASLDLAM